MLNNFTYGVVALAKDTQIFLTGVLSNTMFSGFLTGCILTLIVIGFILSEDPKHIPTMIRYSCEEGFQKISGKDKGSSCILSYHIYQKIHTRVRIFMFLSFISFCTMVSAILFLH